MEVHHHSHTSRKKWTHYFWEFFMLFLAVFCGFLAEYQLEHMIEHNKEKEYMRSMIEDLQQDTIEINRVISVIKVYNKNSDTLLNLLESPVNEDQEYLKKLYKLHYSIGAELVLLSQRTISQLKNAGGLRLIRKKIVADSITLYDSRGQYLSAIFKSYDEISTQTFHAGKVIFDNRFIRHQFKDQRIALLTNEVSVLRQYANCIYTFQGVGRYYRDYLIDHKKLAIELISLIKTKYHFS